MRVSVIIPSHNRAAMLGRALASVFAQTNGDFEVIVVDDASTDDTPDILASARDPRLRCVRHEDRLGANAARNSGLRLARARYIAFLDSDDEWFPAKLDRQLRVFERSSRATGLVYAGTVFVYADSRSRVKIPRCRGRITRRLLVDNVVGSTSTGMVRREVFDVVGGFDETMHAMQDADLWLRISQHFDIDFAPEPLVRIHMHGGADRISYGVDRRLAAREVFYTKHRELFREEGLAHRHYATTAWVQLRRAGDRRESRRCSREAIRARYLSPVGYLSYLSSFVPERAFSWLGSARRTARRVGVAWWRLRRGIGTSRYSRTYFSV